MIFFVNFIIFQIFIIFLSNAYANDIQCTIDFASTPMINNHTYHISEKDSSIAKESIRLDDGTKLVLEYGGCTAVFVKFKFFIQNEHDIAEIDSDFRDDTQYVLGLKLMKLLEKKRLDIRYISDVIQLLERHISHHDVVWDSLVVDGFPAFVSVDTYKKNEDTLLKIHIGISY